METQCRRVTYNIIPATQNQDVSVHHADLQSFMRRCGGLWFWLWFFLWRLGYHSLFLALALAFSLPLGIGVGLRTRFGTGILRLSRLPPLGLLLSSPIVCCTWSNYFLAGLRVHSRCGFQGIGTTPFQLEFHVGTKAEHEQGVVLRGHESTLSKQRRPETRAKVKIQGIAYIDLTYPSRSRCSPCQSDDMIDSNVFSDFLILRLPVMRACRRLGISWQLFAEHLIGITCVSGIPITVVADELGDELSYLVNALWNLFVDPTVAGRCPGVIQA